MPLALLTPRRRMTGGLYFGPAAWVPDLCHSLPVPAPILRLPLPAPTAAALTPPLSPALPLPAPVVRGQPIVPAPAPTQPDLLAPCDGTLEATADLTDGPLLRPALQIVRRAATPDPSPSTSTVAPISLTDLRTHLRHAGIGQLSPQCPSLLAQLESFTHAAAARPNHRLQAVVFNLIPEQPESTLPHALATLTLDHLVSGIQLLRRLVPARRFILAVDRHDFRTARRLRRAVRKTGIRIAWLRDRYPLAQPTVLLRRLLGLHLPVDHLPTDRGVLLVDPVTLWALGTPEPMLTRPLEVFSDQAPPRFVVAELGTPVTHLLNGLAIAMDNTQVILNGMLTGCEIDPQRSVVTAATTSLTVRALPLAEVAAPCVACGWCVDHCPTDLNPLQLHRRARSPSGSRSAEAKPALACIGCGLCSYVCPTRLPLTQDVLGLRDAIRRQLQSPGTEGAA